MKCRGAQLTPDAKNGRLPVSDLRELYQEVILDHNRRPRNFRAIEGANRHAEGYNPLCGDGLSLYLKVEDNVIKDASFQG